jgi:exopolysaccharide biosynthesis WecB/TagA/CpsF family protein
MLATDAAPFPARFPVGSVLISRADYASAVASIIEAARVRRVALVAATSVHGLTLGEIDPVFGRQLNDFDMLTTDGQPVRWALNLLHGAGLSQRVYGPTLMLRVCEVAAANQLGVYLYGARPEVLQRLVKRLNTLVPGLRIAGFHSPPFRALTREEDNQDVRRIVESGAQIVFVGLGCPRQERWAHAHRDRLSLPIVCVGAAFDFHAGTLLQAPVWMQDRGLEWLFRLIMEPRRLCRRYAKHIPLFILLLVREYTLRRVLNRRSVQPAQAREFVSSAIYQRTSPAGARYWSRRIYWPPSYQVFGRARLLGQRSRSQNTRVRTQPR